MKKLIYICLLMFLLIGCVSKDSANNSEAGEAEVEKMFPGSDVYLIVGESYKFIVVYDDRLIYAETMSHDSPEVTRHLVFHTFDAKVNPLRDKTIKIESVECNSYQSDELSKWVLNCSKDSAPQDCLNTARQIFCN